MPSINIIETDYLMGIIQKLVLKQYDLITAEDVAKAYEDLFMRMRIHEAKLDTLKSSCKIIEELVKVQIRKSNGKNPQWNKLADRVLKAGGL